MAGDSTQFLIDMAAKLTGGDSSVATLAALGDHMVKAGATAADMEKVIARASTALEESTAVMSTTSDALSVGEKKYAELETAAERAAKAVEKLGIQTDAQRAKLAAASAESGNDRAIERAAAKLQQLVARQGEAATKSALAAAALKSEAAALDQVRASAGVVSRAHEALGKGLSNVKAAALKAAEAEAKAAGTGDLTKISRGLGAIGGPAAAAGQRLAGFAEGVEKLGVSLGEMGPYVAAAVAIIAIASAAAVATIAIAKWGVELADAGRSAVLMSAGVARSVAGGAELDATISRLADVVPQSAEELQAMAGQLAATGLRGKDLSNALETAAVKAATLKFGPDFGKQMLALDVQSRRLHDNIAKTFGGLHIEALLAGFQTLVALFDSSTASGQALKFLFETLFQPVIDAVSDAIPSVERFFLRAEIMAIKAFIALKPYRAEIQAVGAGFMVGIAIIGGVLAYTILAVVASVGMMVAILGAAVIGLYEIGGVIVNAVVGAFNELKAEVLQFNKLGSDMIDGLIAGITGKATAVADALTSVVSDGVKSVEKFLHIGSPSKLFFEMGANTSAGFAGGVDAGAPDAQSALEALVSPQGSPAAGRGGSQQSVVINITVDGRGESDDGIAQKIAAAVRDLFETDALMLGAGEIPNA